MSQIKFKLSDNNTEVFAHYALAVPNLLKIDEDWIFSKLKDEGLDKYQIIDQNINHLISIVNNAEYGSGKIQLAEARDAEVIIEVKDDLSAYMTIRPAQGGEDVTLAMVKKALAENAIRHGFMLDTIRVAIVSGEAENVLIAKGEPAVDGNDASFNCLLPEIKIRTPRIAITGSVDYRNLGEVTIVERGEPLMRRIPATIGEASKNIFGKVLEPIPGVDTPYSKDLKGVATSEKDPELLIASESGQPVIVDAGISIESTMSIDKVDLSTGNIVFEGTVIVVGDVASGMKIQADGDITVKGMVENAELEAGGDIMIHGAVIGRNEKQNSENENAALTAKGSITAKFTENARLKAKDNIYIQDWVVKSDLDAVNEIVVGNDSTRNGQIIGGSVTSGILVKAMMVGSSAGVKTKIEVGKESDVKQEMDALSSQCFKQEQALKVLHKTIAALKNNPTKHGQEMLDEANSSYNAVENSIKTLRKKQKQLKLQRKRTKNAKVVIDKMVYSGSTVLVAGKKVSFKEDMGKRTLTIKKRELVHLFE